MYNRSSMVERAARGSEGTAFVQRDTNPDILVGRCGCGEQHKRQSSQCSWAEHDHPSGSKECGYECREWERGLEYWNAVEAAYMQPGVEDLDVRQHASLR